MNIKQNLPRWRFYLLWFLTNTILTILIEYAVFVILLMFIFGDEGRALEIYQFAVVSTFVTSALLGIGQWFILKRYFPQSGYWIAATIVGWCISSPLLLWAVTYEFGGVFMVGWAGIAIMLIGGSVGTSQWLVIRRLRYSGWWIVIVILDLGLSLAVGRLVNDYLVASGVPGLAFGLLTGWGVMWLSRKQPDSLKTVEG